MKKKKIIIITVISVILVISLIGLMIVSKSKNEMSKPINNIPGNEISLELTGEQYKPSKLVDENNTKIELSQFSNKPMALLFFNTTEINAKEAINIFQKYYEEDKDKINFINISVIDGVTESKEDVKTYIQNNNITIPILYDTEYTAKNEYEIDTIPTFIFINKNNEIINTIAEDINEDVIEANLDILAENY